MARVSKKVSAAQREAENAPHRIWKTAIYARLSDFDDVLRDTESLQVQISYIKEYIDHRDDLMLLDVFADKRCTGTNFDRPEFERLLKALQERKINCIVVKDFSRFVRDYIEAGDYMERIFPLLGVRFISVNDGYDSGMQAGNDVRGLEVAIKNIINASYSRDLSAKIAAADHVMQKKGMYLGGYRPFGFLSDPNDCHKLILDPVASRYVRLIFELALQGNRTGTIAKILNEKQIPTPAAYHVAENHVYSEQKAWDLQRSHWTSGTVYHILKNEKYKGTYVGAKFIMPVPCKHRVLRAPLEQQVRIEDSHAAIVTPEEFEQAQKVIMLQHGKHQAGNYTKHQYPLKGKVYCGYCQKLMKYRVLKKLGPSFNCRFSATAVDSPCKRIPISEELLEEIVRNALTAQIKQAEHILEILHERKRKALICFSALERQEEKLSEEKAEIVKQRVALYEQYADGNMSKEEFIRQRAAYRVQEDERMAQIQRLRTEKNRISQPVKKDADNLQTVVSAVEESGDVMHLSQNVVETFIDRIEVFNDERVKIHFTFEDTLNSYEEK
jgi:DNA invertase Pin-like site-specific DNA recombinase